MSSLRDLVIQVRDKYGSGAMAQASRGRTFDTKRFSTGIMALDIAVGGGLPWGKILMVYGPESGGKSFLWLKSVAGAQQYCRYCRTKFLPIEETGEITCQCPTECPDCEVTYEKAPYEGPRATEDDPFDWELIHDDWVCECLVAGKTKKKSDRVNKVTLRHGPVRTAWLDAENSYDRDWSEKLGVNNSLVYVIIPEYAEQGIDISEAMLRSGDIDVMIVDSIADLVPSKEIEASAEDWQRGLAARLVNKAVRCWRAALNHAGADNPRIPVILLINQVRTGMGQHGSFEVLPGGKGQLYACTIIIRLNSPKQETDDETGQAIYQDVNGFTKKNKSFPPKAEFSFRAYLRPDKGRRVGDTDEVTNVMSFALDWGVIERPKTTLYTYKDRQWKTQKALATSLASEALLFEEIRQTTMDTAIAEIRG